MKNFAIGAACATVLVGTLTGLASCSTITTALSSPTGQLFCALDSGASGQIVIGVIDAAASSAGAGRPIAVLATGATQAYVQAACAAAAASAGAKAGVPVSPPVAAVPNVAVDTSKLPAGAASK